MKKILAILLMLSMVFCMTAGCSNDGTTDNVSDTSTSSNTGTSNAETPSGGDIKVTVICKAMDSEFWMAVKQGAEDAATELGISVDVKAPDKESNVDLQFKIMEDAIQQKYDAIIIAPCDSEGIIPIIEEAGAANILVLTVDTNANTESTLAFVGTDNVLGGRMAAERMAILFADNPDAKISMITGVPGQQTMRDRIQGFEEGLETAGLTLLDSQPADSDPGKEMNVMENMLTAHPDLDAVFILNATMSVSALEAISNAGSDLKVIGFDSSTDSLEAVADGRMDAVIAQSPYNMGKYAVENAVKAIKGEAIESNIDTGTDLVTIENVSDYLN